MPSFFSEICLVTRENMLEDFFIFWNKQIIFCFKVFDNLVS